MVLNEFQNYSPRFHSDFEASCVINCMYNLMSTYNIKNPFFYFDASLDVYLIKDQNFLIGYRFECDRDTLLPQFHNKILVFETFEMESEYIWEHNRLKLQEGKPLIALVDLFYLPYTGFSGKEHAAHGVIIYGHNSEKNEVFIIDDYKWFYNGSISIANLLEAMNSQNPFSREHVFSGTSISNNWIELILEGWNGDFYELFRTNVEYTIKHYYNAERKYKNDYQGVLFLKKMSEIIKEFQYEEHNRVTDFLFELRTMFYLFSFRLKLFRHYLEMGVECFYNERLYQFIEQFNQDIKKWDVFLNVILKAHYNLTESAYAKVITKFEENMKREENRYDLLYQIYRSL